MTMTRSSFPKDLKGKGKGKKSCGSKGKKKGVKGR